MAQVPWTLGALTGRLAARYGSRTAALLERPLPLPGFERARRLTFADLEALVGRAARGLRLEGIGPGDRVAIPVQSELAGLLTALAAARAGAQPALLYGQPLVKRGARRPMPAGDGAGPGVVVFTSGTTGTPKGVPLTDAGLESSLRFARLAPDLTIGRDDRAVAALPLAHVFGLVIALAYLEARVPALHLPRFDPAAVLAAIPRVRASVFAGVPAMYRMLEETGAEEADLRTIRLWISGADAMPRDLARRFQRRGSSLAVGSRSLLPAFFVEGYGLVEATGPALFRALGPVGVMRTFRPLPGWRARAVDEEGEPVAHGEPGTLELSGPGVVAGYLGERPREREWLRTQDLATVSRTQGVEILGRSDDLLKVGGHRLHPGEVEAVLLAHPAVADAGVTSVPHAAKRLASYKVPRRVQVVDAIPRTPTGKIRRGVLRERLSADR